MTFEQALHIKNSKIPFVKHNISFIWMVVPLEQSDKERYKSDYILLDDKFTDEDAKKYSNDYTVEYMPKR